MFLRFYCVDNSNLEWGYNCDYIPAVGDHVALDVMANGDQLITVFVVKSRTWWFNPKGERTEVVIVVEWLENESACDYVESLDGVEAVSECF